jgi:integrase
MNKQTDRKLKNHPGIYKRYYFDEGTGKWNDTGKYRAIRKVMIDGVPKKQNAVFGNLGDAKAYRAGRVEKVNEGNNVHRNHRDTDSILTFGGLVDEWKPFHYLQLEPSTQQMYDKRLPTLDYLRPCPVREITASVIDEMVKYWVKELPKGKQRENFEKELNLLKVILNFYRKRKDPSYVIPVLLEHFKAADIAKKAQTPVMSLSQEDLGRFLEELRNGKTPFYPLALAQFCLGLRIGEVCGMTWDAVDLENRVAKIEQTIVWDQYAWLSKVKNRPKNGKVRYQVIPEVLFRELEQLKKVRDRKVSLIFHKKSGEPYNRQSIGKAFNRALERMGIHDVKGTHWVRKTSATLANQITGDFYAVSRLMDHSSPNVTLRYVAPTNLEKRKVADALNSVVERLPQGTAREKTHIRGLKPKSSPNG